MAHKNDTNHVLTENQKKALQAWCKWYSSKLDLINGGQHPGLDYTGYEQDLFEAFHCATDAGLDK